MLKTGYKQENELNELRQRRKNGKKLEKFYRKQNTVSLCAVSVSVFAFLNVFRWLPYRLQLIGYLLKSMEEHTEEAREAEEETRLQVCGLTLS